MTLDKFCILHGQIQAKFLGLLLKSIESTDSQ